MVVTAQLKQVLSYRKEVKFPTLSLKREKGGAPWSLVTLKKDVDQGGDYQEG
jgi:hypothetical protein